MSKCSICGKELARDEKGIWRDKGGENYNYKEGISHHHIVTEATTAKCIICSCNLTINKDNKWVDEKGQIKEGIGHQHMPDEVYLQEKIEKMNTLVDYRQEKNFKQGYC